MLKVVKIGWAIFANYEYFIIRMLAMAMAKWQRWFLTTFDKYKMNCICLEAMIWMIKSKGESREENVCNLAANWQWFISFYVWIFADRSLWLLHCLTSCTWIVNHNFNSESQLEKRITTWIVNHNLNCESQLEYIPFNTIRLLFNAISLISNTA